VGIFDDALEWIGVRKEKKDSRYKPGDTPEKRRARHAAMREQTRRQDRAEGRIYDVHGVGRLTQEELVATYVGGQKGLDVLGQRTGFGVPDLNLDKAGELSSAEKARMFVYHAPDRPVSWRDDDGRMTSSTRERALMIDRGVQAVLQLEPSLIANPDALMTIATEPFLADRLRGMDRAQTWLTLRRKATELEQMPEEHQTMRWEHLLPQEQRALRDGGYTPPEERPEVSASGITSLLPGWGKLGTAGEYLGLDAAYDKVDHLPSNAFGGAADLMNNVGTAYRTLQGMGEQGYGTFGSGLGSWDTWKETWDDAWEGEKFFHQEARDEAMGIAEGDQERYNLYRRLAGGDTVDEIASDFADEGTTEYGDVFQQLKAFEADERTIRAIGVLNRGKVSFGRDATEIMLGIEEGEEWLGFIPVYTLSSGGLDALFQIGTDPTLLAGKAMKGYSAARWGLNAARLAGETDTAFQIRSLAQITRRLGTVDGQDVAAVVRAHRAGKVVDVTSLRYKFDLWRLPVSKPQRALVAMADHMNAAKHGDDMALMAWNKAMPGARKMMYTFEKYVDKAIPKTMGLIDEEIDAATVVKFYRTAPRARTIPKAGSLDELQSGVKSATVVDQSELAAGAVRPGTAAELLPAPARPIRPVTADDVVDFTRDESGLYALMSGQWTSVRWDQAQIPRLTKLGTSRIMVKTSGLKALDWLEDEPLRLSGQLVPEDVENPQELMHAIAEELRQGGVMALDDELHQLRLALQNSGVDADSVTRFIERDLMDKMGIEAGADELPAHAVMRAIVTADVPEDGAAIMDAWETMLAQVMDPGDASDFMELAFHRYRNAMGVDADDMFTQRLDFDTAIAEASHGGDRGVATARPR
jgi:hypothetical protein